MMEVRLYEENEVHKCQTCGQTIRVTWAAVPVEPLQCCGVNMDFLGVLPENDDLDLSDAPLPENALPHIYQVGEKYSCDLCGIEVVILRRAQATKELDCCGEGMRLLAD